MQRERGLMREDASLLGPEPYDGQLFVLPWREVHQTIDAAADSANAPCPHVMRQQLRRVASHGSLVGREITILGRCDFEEAVPTWLRCFHLGQAQTLSIALVLCNQCSPQHFLCLIPLPHGQGALRLIFGPVATGGRFAPSS